MKKGSKIPEEEVKERLRGCYGCPLKVNHEIIKDGSSSLQPRVKTRVTCATLNNQVVSPTTAAHFHDCHRLKHVEAKKFNPRHIAARSGTKNS